jgi:hypothetical protein
MRERLVRLKSFLFCAALMVMTPIGMHAQEGQAEMPGRGQFAGGQMVRGTVTATAADHLTVKTDGGDVYQVAISANTRLNKNRQPIKVSDIKVGDNVGAMGVLDAPTKTVHAVFIGVVDAEQAKKMREGLGKEYIVGKITAIDIDALKITVSRPDGVSQVIAVDEGTSFRRGGRGMRSMINGVGPVDTTRGTGSGSSGESITLADVKVGDSVAGPGTMKNGVFVPSELGVMDAAAQQRRRRQGGIGTPETGGPTAPTQQESPTTTSAPR